jgi:hypothetical protein
MFSARLIRNLKVKASAVAVRNMGGGHHGPMMPPFVRIRPPSATLPEECELVWDDSVAPETCIDFDASHVSSKEVISMWALGLAFFAGLFTLISLSDVPSRSPVAKKAAVLSIEGYKYDIGLVDEINEDHDE